MISTQVTSVLLVAGVTAQIVAQSKQRIALIISGQVAMLISPDRAQAATAGLVLTPVGAPTEHFTRASHPDLVARDWFANSVPGGLVTVIEVLED